MKKKILSVIFSLACITVCMSSYQPVLAAEEKTEKVVLEETNPYQKQAEIDKALQAELDKKYSFEEPMLILDPYGDSPLSAVMIFSTEEPCGGTITVKGKKPENDIIGTFEKATEHLIPVYGLYNGDTTQIEVSLDDGRKYEGSITTEKIDEGFDHIEITMNDEEAYDYANMTIVCSVGSGIYGIDAAGDVRWYYGNGGSLGVHQLKNGHLCVQSTYLLKTSYYKQGLMEIDLNGKVYREYIVPGGMHHDFQELSNGNLLIASDSPDFSSVEDYVVEIDRMTGEVVWELDMKDLLDIKDGESASIDTDGGDEEDWFHNNGIWYDEDNDLILLSARHKDAIVAVNKSEKTLAWILGDPSGWETTDEGYFFTPVGDDFEWQYAQHQVTMLDNGDIMMFDNGTAKVKRADGEKRVSGDDVYSRAVIYHINTEDMTIEQVFEYGKERGAKWYSDWISGVVSLDGTQDHLWVTAGSHLFDQANNRHDHYPRDMFNKELKKSTHIDQVDNGELSFEMIISGMLTYRSFRMPLYNQKSDLNLSEKAELLGGLGESPYEENIDSLENLPNLEGQWNFMLDKVKLSFTGSYSTKEAVEDIGDGYLILKSGETEKRYKLSLSGAKGKDNTNVTVKGWVSRQGLENASWDIFVKLQDQVYQTDYSMNM